MQLFRLKSNLIRFPVLWRQISVASPTGNLASWTFLLPLFPPLHVLSKQPGSIQYRQKSPCLEELTVGVFSNTSPLNSKQAMSLIHWTWYYEYFWCSIIVKDLFLFPVCTKIWGLWIFNNICNELLQSLPPLNPLLPLSLASLLFI